MSDFLKAAPRFTFKAVTDRETPSVNGQMLDFVSVSRVSVERPNKVRVDTTGDRFAASLWYDGKTLSIFSDKSSFYAQVAGAGDDRRDRPDAPRAPRHAAAGRGLPARRPVREDDRAA